MPFSQLGNRQKPSEVSVNEAFGNPRTPGVNVGIHFRKKPRSIHVSSSWYHLSCDAEKSAFQVRSTTKEGQFLT